MVASAIVFIREYTSLKDYTTLDIHYVIIKATAAQCPKCALHQCTQSSDMVVTAVCWIYVTCVTAAGPMTGFPIGSWTFISYHLLRGENNLFQELQYGEEAWNSMNPGQ